MSKTWEIKFQKKIKKLVEKASKNYKVGAYLDVNLFKKVGNKDAIKVTSLNGKLKASFLLPENLRKYGESLVIVRVHNGETKILNGTYNAKTYMFTFETDRFSTYALMYTSSPKTGDESNMTGVNVLMALSFISLSLMFLLRKRV